MGRSLKKGPYVDPKLYQKVEKQNQVGTKEPIKTWARACTVIPEFVGHTFMVHNGKNHIKVFVTEEVMPLTRDVQKVELGTGKHLPNPSVNQIAPEVDRTYSDVHVHVTP